MTWGKAEQEKAFDHITISVFGQPRDSTFIKALRDNNFTDPEIWALSSDRDIASYNLGPYQKLISVFRDYIRFKQITKEPIRRDSYVNIAEDDFQDFQVGMFYPLDLEILARFHPNIVPPSDPSIVSKSLITPVEKFQRSIKLDSTLYPVLKDERQWDSWRRTTIAIARTHGVDDIFDLKATGSPADKDLFDAKQKYVYQIFERTLQTDEGKTIVRAHEDDYDAKRVFEKLVAHAKHSTKASLSAGDLLTYITSVRADDGTWKGSSLGFINHFMEQIRLYQDQVSNKDSFSKRQQLKFLENAVAPWAHLSAVKGQADLHKTQTGNYPTLEQYISLLKSAATTYDRSLKKKHHPLVTPRRRAVYTHEIMEDGEDENYFEVDDEDYYIDSPYDILLANAHQRIPPAPNIRLPNDKWNMLSPEGRQAWMKLPAEVKRVILSNASAQNQLKRPTSNAKKTRFANQHEQYLGSDGDVDDSQFYDAHDTGDEVYELADNDDKSLSINKAKSQPPHPADLRSLMSTSSKRSSSTPPKPSPKTTSANEVFIDGKRCVLANNTVIYNVSASSIDKEGSLVDCGANGGVGGSDTCDIPGTTSHQKVHIKGVDKHEVPDIPIKSVGGVTPTQFGEVIAIFNQYAGLGRGRTIHSPGQMEHFKLKVNDKSVKVGGTQRIITPDGYIMPLDIVQGLACMQLRPFTDEEWETLPHVIMTSDNEWDPTVLDYTHEDDTWYDAREPGSDDFDEFGDFRHRTVAFHDCMSVLDIDDPVNLYDYEDVIESCVHYAHTSVEDTHNTYLNFNHVVQRAPPDYASLQRFFAYLPVDIIKRTFANTTQYAKTTLSTILKKHYKSPFPAFNVRRRDEPVATDYIYSDTPAVDDGSTGAQIFVGTKSMVVDAYGCKTTGEFVNTLEDNIRRRGAMSKLISDSAAVEMSNRVQKILCAYIIDDWQSEPDNQHQNPAERHWQTCN